MKIYILLLLLSPALNAMEGSAQGSKIDETPSSINTGLDIPIDSFDGFFDSPDSPPSPENGKIITDELISPPSKMMRMDSTRLNKDAEEKYHLSYPALFYKSNEEILTSKIKNFGKILRCGTNVDIGRVGRLLSQMPAVLQEVQKIFEVILKNLKETSEEYIKLNIYKEFAMDIKQRVDSLEPHSVNELLAVFGNINASIIEAQSILSQLIKKRLEALLQEVQTNKNTPSLTSSFFHKSQDVLSDHVRRIENAIKVQNKFSNLQKDILSFSNLLQDFFLEDRTEEGKKTCSADQLLAALKDSK
ncbi:MAG: hypothetical protein K2Q34_08535 [Alphaproteobacteria bacterium]|nr:hypothetical protein [Alphaproteobacteria bacterium]